jgi:hypothetical protein
LEGSLFDRGRWAIGRERQAWDGKALTSIASTLLLIPTSSVSKSSLLVRHFVLFVIDLKSRRVHIAGIAHQPHQARMKQVA